VTNNDAYPLMTSNNMHGDTATQGFNDSVEVSLDHALAYDPMGTPGLRANGSDILVSTDDDGEQQIQLPDVLDRTTHDARTEPHAVRTHLQTMVHQTHNMSYVRIQAPTHAGSFGFYWSAPSGSINAVQTFQILTQDPKRYRVKLHPWVASGSPGVIWIGADPGNVQQAASNNLSLSAYPLSAGNANTFNEHEFYWNDDMWAALDVSATVATYLFVTVERYDS
jgi:hypothetical protein